MADIDRDDPKARRAQLLARLGNLNATPSSSSGNKASSASAARPKSSGPDMYTRVSSNASTTAAVVSVNPSWSTKELRKKRTKKPTSRELLPVDDSAAAVAASMEEAAAMPVVVTVSRKRQRREAEMQQQQQRQQRNDLKAAKRTQSKAQLALVRRENKALDLAFSEWLLARVQCDSMSQLWDAFAQDWKFKNIPLHQLPPNTHRPVNLYTQLKRVKKNKGHHRQLVRDGRRLPYIAPCLAAKQRTLLALCVEHFTQRKNNEPGLFADVLESGGAEEAERGVALESRQLDGDEDDGDAPDIIDHEDTDHAGDSGEE